MAYVTTADTQPFRTTDTVNHGASVDTARAADTWH